MDKKKVATSKVRPPKGGTGTKASAVDRVYIASLETNTRASDRAIEAYEKDIAIYRPSRLEFFVAAALTGLLAGPDAAISVSVKAVEYAKAAIRQIDKE